MRLIYILLTAILFLCCADSARAQFPAACDVNKACIGNALTIEVTSGKGAQYVDVDTSARLRALDVAMTFEAWIKPQPQPGKRQFIGGLWGPNKDNNDQWVLYLEDENITFALSPDGSYQGDADNTIVTASVPGLYGRGWVHVAAVWDGASTSARIFVDGFETARGVNGQFPLTILKKIENPKLQMQLASCNGLFDDTTRYRTFRGQIDEVRLWNRALVDQEIRCQRMLSLNGNEGGLILYYRCNEPSSGQVLCDATGNPHAGLMRSGAICDSSDRVVPATYVITPTSVTQSLYCTSDTTLTFSIVDTSFCGSNVALQLSGADARLFTLSHQTLTLVQNVPQTFTVQMKATLIGNISANLRVLNANRCGSPVQVPLRYTRRTELDYSVGRLRLDTLFVGCIEQTTTEDTLEICNNTGRPMNLDSLRLKIDTIFNWRPANPGQVPAPGAPLTLAPGTCWKVIVQMKVADTTRTFYDTLRIYSDDRCPGSGIIPVQGHSQEVIAIMKENGIERLDSMNFADVCPGQISDVELYQYRNLVREPVNIDTIIVSNGFFTRRNIYPIVLAPGTAYQPTFVRFRPDRPGPFTGQMIFRTSYRGCTIEKKVELTGRGISVDVDFNSALIGFGNVTIGKVGQQQASFTNNGRDARSMSAYLKVGDVFTITSGRSFVIVPGQTAQLDLEFRPREQKTYYDTLCIFDNQCFQTICIPITGTGVFEALAFDPSYISMENVIGCRCLTDTIQVRNNLSSTLNFTWTKNDLTGKFDVRQLVSASSLPAGGSTAFVVTYCPNDLVNDRSDRAFIDIRLSDGQLYQVLLHGTSVAPKLYVTPLTAFGVVEVGWRKRDRILVENTSAVPIRVTGANVPPGYTVISTTPALPVVLNPRDSLWVEVELAPTAEGSYNGQITLVSDDPCQLGWSGDLSGRGVVVKLDVPVRFINYGLIKPCDCAVREIPLPNISQYIPLDIDSVWIDAGSVTSPNPAVFIWQSRQTGGSTLPYQILPQSVDTLLVSFCPNIPAEPQNLLSNAVLHIRSRTPGWTEEFEVTLSGRREMNFQPNRTLVAFPATRVDTAAQPITVEISVPDQFSNPSGDSIVITGMSFVPDQRVFSVEHPLGQPFPWVVKRGQKLAFRVKFYPRAPKDYVARLNIHTSFPCQGTDTTILVTGTGFAPAFGLQMAFDTANVGRDTINLTTCDTLELPVMISRAIPQDIIDIAFRVGYDSTAMKLLGITTPYTSNAVVADTGDGARAYLKDARMVQAGTIAYLRFAVTQGPTAFPLTLDEIEFDSDSLVFFKIIAGIDRAWVRIDQPMIAITKATSFDTVNIKSCADRQIVVSNPGAIPITFDSLSGLPPGHRVTASSIPYPAVLAPGDSIILTLTFCPFMEMVYDSVLRAHSNTPCPIADTGAIHSFGYAPPFPMAIVIGDGITPMDVITGAIADTVEVPISVDRDVPQTPLDVTVLLEYNRRALQFIEATSSYTTQLTASESSAGLLLSLPDCDSLKRGEIALLKFLVAVPDSIVSQFYLIPQKFTSDSNFWVKLDPPITTGDTATVRVDARCNISRLNFRGGANKLSAVTPNPTRGSVAIEAEFVEDARAALRIFNSAGVEVYQVLDGSMLLSGGRYRFEFDISFLPSGDYYCMLQAGRFSATERMKIVK